MKTGRISRERAFSKYMSGTQTYESILESLLTAWAKNLVANSKAWERAELKRCLNAVVEKHREIQRLARAKEREELKAATAKFNEMKLAVRAAVRGEIKALRKAASLSK